jgi:hypothetical protein
VEGFITSSQQRHFGLEDGDCFSETLASTDESTRRQNPEKRHHHPHRRQNFKSHEFIVDLTDLAYTMLRNVYVK